ncbi:MAG: hypothetical protein FE78DRAFT_73425 [Acidomyces sp. 'richmondensis']|nr:MAG: hypothetical protein FE78DRAFT_73425 [Acidomyces sp. 'richmondensis']
MAAQKTRKTTNHKWDEHQRTVVYMLHKHFDNLDNNSRTKIFNAFFKAQLDEEKYALRAQYAERDKKPHIWADICATPSSGEQWQKRLELIQQLQQVAVALGLNVRTKIPVAADIISRGQGTHITPTKLSKRTKDLVTIEDCFTTAKRVKRAATVSSTKIAAPLQRTKLIETETASAVSTRPCLPVQRRPHATILYTLPSGRSMWLTPEEFRITQDDFVPVSKKLAHPPVPPLLFRYWCSSSQSTLINGEFRARSFPSDDVDIPPMPELDDIKYFPWNRIFYHLNRDHVDSPFISTSNCFFWVLRLAVKERARGISDGAISLIDTSELDLTKAYYIPPFHRELLKKHAFQNGAQRYHGSHEFIIYHKIPKNAVICTFQLCKLFDLADRIPAIQNILRFQVLEAEGDYRSELRGKLEEDNVELSPGIVAALAQIVKLCLDCQSPVEQIGFLVAEIVFGWAFILQHAKPEEWLTIAAVFSHVLCGNSKPNGIVDEQRAKLAFLEGVKWGCGSYNTRHTPKAVLKMQNKAQSIGLGCPAKLLSNELGTLQLDLWLFERQQQRVIQSLTST